MKLLILLASCFSLNFLAAQDLAFTPLFNGKDLSGWVDVNTSPETWRVENGEIVCTGLPIGVMR